MEDNASDAYLIKDAIKSSGLNASLHVVRDGEMAIKYFDELDAGASPCPALVLLDINLPKISGLEVLRHLRSSQKCRYSPVIIVSTSDHIRDREETMRLGANAYFSKPSAYDNFMKLGDLIRDMLPDGKKTG